MLQPQKTGWFGAFCEISIAAAFIFSLLFLSPANAEAAASLYVQPAGGTFTLDGTFTVSLYVNTGGQAVNAIEANLKFPSDKLQIVSPTTGRSLIQVWVAQPTYSNVDGTLKFQGTIPTPGINTDAGLISTVTFRVKNIGTAYVNILDSSQVLLNDGLGTNILSQRSGSIYNLVLPAPAGPLVSSRTHTDQGKWYKSSNPIFEWVPPEDAAGYSYILTQEPSEEPDNVSEGLKSRVGYSNLADGIYFFHIKALRQGVWGGVTTYAVNIDTSPPAEFSINISPASRTSNERPIIDFATTDAVSGVDHYEIKIIPLDPPRAFTGQNETPFFFETVPPYSGEFADGRYEVIVRAYDQAGNYTQAEERLTITRPLFEFIVSDGLRIGGGYVVSWPWLVVIGILLLAVLGWFARLAWGWHRQIEEQLTHGPAKHPAILEKLDVLKTKQKEYKEGKSLMVLILLLGLAIGMLGPKTVSAEENLGNVKLEPPIVTLFPKTASNDEIVYIGGRGGASQAKVLIYLQNIETGSTLNYVAVTDKNGEWFYSFPKFLGAGEYVAWTQLEVGEEISPPSSRLDLSIAQTAIQIGSRRLSFEDFYFVLLLLFIAAFAVLLSWVLYHSYHFRAKNRKFLEAVREAEESIRRGFALLHRDIEDELKILRKARLSKELSAEEHVREEKLMRDLDEIGRHLGEEVWQIEHVER